MDSTSCACPPTDLLPCLVYPAMAALSPSKAGPSIDNPVISPIIVASCSIRKVTPTGTCLAGPDESPVRDIAPDIAHREATSLTSWLNSSHNRTRTV